MNAMDPMVDLQRLDGLRLVLCNWRDRQHPRAGGAEVYCEEIATRFAAAGAHVTLLTARSPGAPAEELRSGVHVMRRGGSLGVYAWAAAWLRRNRAAYDAVIDFQNGIPFFAPLAVGRRVPVVCVIHHVHQDQFDLYLPGPASRLARFLEGPVSRTLYGRRAIAAVSPSTRAAVRRRLRLRGPIYVVPNGITEPVVAGHRSRTPRIVCISRLVAHKRVDRLIDAVAALRERWPGLELDVAGAGPEREALEALAARRGVADVVRFHGFVSEEDKARLLGSAWLTVNPSMAEGWGLTVIEANAAGVPAVAYDVPGLADSIVPGTTGWLAPTDEDLSHTIGRALHRLADRPTAEEVSWRCRTWASHFQWDDTARRMAAVVLSECGRAESTGGETRRSTKDLTVVAEFDQAGDDVVARLGALRGTDSVHVLVDGIRAVLSGCDETEAAAVLDRLRIGEVPRLRLAAPADLLVPAGLSDR